jgi:hypothetical protein
LAQLASFSALRRCFCSFSFSSNTLW